MILGDLFEGRMKDIDIEYQDFLRSRGRNAMTDRQFQDAYGMTRTEWAKKNRVWTQQKERLHAAPDAHLFHEDSQQDRNARIIAGELEDARTQGNQSLVQQKIKELQKLGYYFDKQGQLQRMGMYEQGVEEDTARERWNQASAEREKKHNEIEARRQAAAKQGRTDVPGAIKRLEKALGEATQQLSIGDPVIIQGTEYNGKTGEIKEFSPSGKFAVVDLYNYGPQAFSLANVKYNEYADNEEQVDEEKVRLDPKCWSGKKIGNPKTKVKGGVRVNNCVPK